MIAFIMATQRLLGFGNVGGLGMTPVSAAPFQMAGMLVSLFQMAQSPLASRF
jgi:hypothetical protein